MSASNFAPQIWSARVQANLDKALVIGARANRSYEVDARHGVAKINKAGDIAVSSYTAGSTTLSYPNVYSTQQTLTLNQRKTATFKTDDLDAVQANNDLFEDFTQRMGYSLADDIDRYLAGLYTSAGAGDVAIDIAAVAASEVRDAFADAGALLDMNNVPAVGRWALLSPKFQAAMFKDTAITQATDRGDAILASGAVGRFMGFDLYQTNNLLGTGVTVTTTADEPQGETTIAVQALAGAIPNGTILTFGPGKYVRLTAAASVSDTTITVAPLTVALGTGSVATYVKVRKAMFGTNAAITFAMNLAPRVEAVRDKDDYYDYVRAEQNYGALVLEPYALGTFTVTEAS